VSNGQIDAVLKMLVLLGAVIFIVWVMVRPGGPEPK
jgi:hypothetical protein